MNFIEWFWDETTTWLVQFLTQQIKYWKMKLGGEVLKWACVEFHQVAAGNIWTNPSNFVITQILEGPLNRIVYDIMNDFITRKKQNKQMYWIKGKTWIVDCHAMFLTYICYETQIQTYVSCIYLLWNTNTNIVRTRAASMTIEHPFYCLLSLFDGTADQLW